MSTTAAAVPKQPVRLADYTPPAWSAESMELVFELFETQTRVTATSHWARVPGEQGPLLLDGVGLETESLRLDDELIDVEAARDGDTLALCPDGKQCTLQVVTLLDPGANTTLEGLYRSSGVYCTQMEAQGFRHVTWFADRPDVMTTWTTTVVADAKSCPVLLGNGNLTDSGPAADGRHFASFHDPHKKPAYLFALVAGDLASVEGSFVTCSGRSVTLKVWVEHGEERRADHALQSLKRSMAWDERAFGREYDLDVFHIVAVADFNMGAMENKGLNIFNSALVLAAPETATDEDYQRIEGVVGHEYFHNWSGNRVTCRDWFQLSLKEGFTVFRDQEFSADVGGRQVQRIASVRWLRELQFSEDAGPQAHPIRPAEYLAIDNFYTTTVYEKGAEVVRMLATLAGPEGFRKGTDLYFERHDGQAVTTDDFVAAIGDATGLDLSVFLRWYQQAGTPRLTARGKHDAGARTYELTLSQSTPATPGQSSKLPVHIPVAMGLLDSQGRPLSLRLQGEPDTGPAPSTRVLSLTAASATYLFTGIDAPPVPSLLRGFSAPVVLDDGLSPDQLAFLVAHDSDGFNRWEAGQRLFAAAILDELAGKDSGARAAALSLPPALLGQTDLDPAFAAEALSLPSELELASRLEVVDPEALHQARERLAGELADAHGALLLARHDTLAATETGALDPESAGARALKLACLTLLVRRPNDGLISRLEAQLHGATTMTDELGALEQLCHLDHPARDRAVARFRERWQADALVMNKWFAVQASSRRASTLDDVLALAGDPLFTETNPNKMRSLYRNFARNLPRFHGADGRGYRLLADVVLRLDRRNPVLAGRMASLFGDPARVEPARRALLRAELARVAATDGLSANALEMVGHALG